MIVIYLYRKFRVINYYITHGKIWNMELKFPIKYMIRTVHKNTINNYGLSGKVRYLTLFIFIMSDFFSMTKHIQ